MGVGGITPALVWARAWILGAVVLGAGAVSHVAADGLLPGPVGLCALGAGSVLASGIFLRVPVGRARMLALVLGGQTLVHTALSVLAGHRGGPADAAPVVRLADPQAALTAVAGRGTFQDQLSLLSSDAVSGAPPGRGAALDWGFVAHLVQHITQAGPLMVLAHLGAAAAVAWWLAAGEAALWRLVELVTEVLCLRLAVLDPPDSRPWLPGSERLALPTTQRVPRPGSAQDPRARPRRGPPRLLAA